MNFEMRTMAPRDGDAAVPVVEIRGDIDTTNAADLQAALARVASGGLVVDLSPVGYIDSAGFAVIDDLLSRATMALVVSPGSVVRAAVSLMNMPFHDTVASARASLHAA